MDPVSVPVGGRKGRLTVVAKVYVDPKRTKARNGRKQDTLTLRVAVGKRKYSKVKKPRSVGCCQTQHC